MTAWVVRGGRDNVWVTDFLDRGGIWISYGVTENLAKWNRLDDLRKLYLKERPNEQPRTATSNATQLRDFRDGIKIGDLIITPHGPKGPIAIGEATGEYEYRPPEHTDVVHLRRVKWIHKQIPKDTLDNDLQKSINAAGAIFRTRATDAEKRLRAIAETVQDIDSDSAAHSDGRWDAFVSWAKLFYEWELFHEREREYKLHIGEQLAAVKKALQDGNPDWQNLLKTTLKDRDNNLTHWRANDAFFDLDPDAMEEALRRIWELDSPSTLEQRVQGFQDFGEFETPAVIASILLMGDDPTQYPMYRHTPLRDAFQLIGYPSTPE